VRLAWFRATACPPPRSLDPTAAVIERLSAAHDLLVVTPAEAHDFVWQNFHTPVDLCVYELDDRPAAAFLWPYLFRFPGLLVVSGASVHNGRAATLQQQGRDDDYKAEFAFNEGHAAPSRHKVLPRGSWPMLRAPIAASRLTIVRDGAVAERLRTQFPGHAIHHVPLGVDGPPEGGSDEQSESSPPPRRAGHEQSGLTLPIEGGNRSHDTVCRCLVYGDGRVEVAARAAGRAHAGHTRFDIVPGDYGAPLQPADIVVALSWAPGGESLMPALAGMAAGLPVIVFEAEATADWPTVDPQTWQPRDRAASEAPIAIALDPRDEEHSLVLALRRLASDEALRSTLGTAARAWWQSHGTLEQSIRAWQAALDAAASTPPPPRPADWPAHLAADGGDSAREVLRAFGVDVDLGL
jgi:hypothetical protein